MNELDHESHMRRAIALAARVPDRPFAAVIFDRLNLARLHPHRCFGTSMA